MSPEQYIANIPVDALYMYVRSQGRLKGLFRWQQLRRMVTDHELSRIHELSIDKHHWEPAGGYSLLFTPNATQPNPYETLPQGQWFYEIDDRARGPVDFRSLRNWILNDWLSLPARVWSSGMLDWTEIESIPSFFPQPV